MSKDNRDIDPDDFFADTRMSFGDHIEDLRVHLLRAVKGFMFFCIAPALVVSVLLLARGTHLANNAKHARQEK